MKHTSFILAALLALIQPICCLGDGPTDNQAAKVRPVPPPGGMISEVDRLVIRRGKGFVL
ncbi:MAG: hypothetical protein NTV12_12415 [Verrucomicrobia bacterium]|nr:hypothetical protein [Verrucomicrobiota bacterium]